MDLIAYPTPTMPTMPPYMWKRGMDLVWILNGYSPGTVSKKLARRSTAPQDMLEDLLLHHAPHDLGMIWA